MNIPTFTPHPLREKMLEHGITLSQLKAAMGGKPSESRLSHLLTGKSRLPLRLEQLIRAALTAMGVL